MILTHKNDDGYIYSYFEFDVVDKDGKWKDKGEYMYVRDIWIHPDYRGLTEINKYIAEAEELKETKNVQNIYWIRTKWDEDGNVISQNISELFNREKCLKLKPRSVKC